MTKEPSRFFYLPRVGAFESEEAANRWALKKTKGKECYELDHATAEQCYYSMLGGKSFAVI